MDKLYVIIRNQMKKYLLSILLLSISQIFSQNSILSGTWILDKTIYEDGNYLEINHPLFSNFTEYEFLSNHLKINGKKFNAKYSQNSIKLDFRELLFSYQNEYLLIQEKGDNKIQVFLKNEDFITKYPIFKSEQKIINQDTIYISNDVYKPKFQNDLNFEDFLRINIPSYNATSTKNNLFKSEFVLTKDNIIKEINITQGISKSFDSEFITALKKAQPYFKNETGKDLLIKHNFNFFKMFSTLTNKSEKEFYSIQKKAKEYFEKNEFEKAISEYEKLNNISDLHNLKEKFGFIYNEAFINLGISYLALNKIENACSSFIKVGGITDFSVRNYLINYCK